MIITISAADFRQNLEHYFDEAQERPVPIESQVGRNALLVVSSDFYDRAIEAEDQLDLEVIRKTKTDTDIPFEAVLEQLGLDPNNL